MCQIGNAAHIVYCTNAEVLVKDELNVYNSLKWICVRSKADKDTFQILTIKSLH
ncbi:hypothetical protein M947_08760 [Sulfurimonas hongkongensis]|uniref:Uncharacterized protein n=1 Tax=Sulfurimonas hongkongensis TaxID=1172190 RepID=T0KQ07_9BACT|nr:hypothetical protein M947_08760 [Sulfurimonas hongkongensis]